MQKNIQKHLEGQRRDKMWTEKKHWERRLRLINLEQWDNWKSTADIEGEP